ncbi:MAG: class I SAM-dependent methyltransferase [Ignavibacteria bacterium]
MFTKSARFYDALYHFKDYAEASERLREIIEKYNPEAKILLDTACGTGKHIEHLKKYYDAEGLDLNDELLEIARKRCPQNIFHSADMTDFKLNKKYDVVTCLFSSIAYVKSEEKLLSAITCMTDHLKPNGVLIIEPWFNKETFWTNHITSNHFDEDDMKITWMYRSERKNDLSILDINYLVGTANEVSYFTEKHELGLFDDTQYRGAFEASGLTVDYDKEGLFGRGMYIGVSKIEKGIE